MATETIKTLQREPGVIAAALFRLLLWSPLKIYRIMNFLL